MKILKRAGVYYLTGLFALAVHILLLSNPTQNLFTELPFSLVPALVVVIGLILGWFGQMIIQYSKFVQSFYLLGLNFCFVLFIIAILIFQIKAKRDDRRYGYDFSARYMLEMAEEDGRIYVINGFEKLQKAFPHPNKVHLLGYRSVYRDTIVHSRTDSVITVYYTYFFDKDSTVKLFSKVELWRDKADIVAFNQLPTADTTYQRLDKSYYEQRKKMIDSLVSIFKSSK